MKTHNLKFTTEVENFRQYIQVAANHIEAKNMREAQRCYSNAEHAYEEAKSAIGNDPDGVDLATLSDMWKKLDHIRAQINP